MYFLLDSLSENYDFNDGILYNDISIGCSSTKPQETREKYIITADGINEIVEIKIEKDDSGLTATHETKAENLYQSQEPGTSNRKERIKLNSFD